MRNTPADPRIDAKPQTVWICAPEGKRPKKSLPVIGVVFLGVLLTFLTKMSLDRANIGHQDVASDILDSCINRTSEAATLGTVAGNLRIAACFQNGGEIKKYYMICKMAHTNSACANLDDCWGAVVLPPKPGQTRGPKPTAFLPKATGWGVGTLKSATYWWLTYFTANQRKSVSGKYLEELRPSPDFVEQVRQLRTELGYK